MAAHGIAIFSIVPVCSGMAAQLCVGGWRSADRCAPVQYLNRADLQGPRAAGRASFAAAHANVLIHVFFPAAAHPTTQLSSHTAAHRPC
jgi:hypothetical protein